MILYTIAHGIELSPMDDHSIERVVPHPVVREENHPRREHHQAHQVEVRLMVTDDHSRFLEGLAHSILQVELHAWHPMDDKVGHLLQKSVIQQILLFCILTDMEI